jgi:hypothetical protein
MGGGIVDPALARAMLDRDAAQTKPNWRAMRTDPEHADDDRFAPISEPDIAPTDSSGDDIPF